MPRTIATQGLRSLVDIQAYNAFAAQLGMMEAEDVSTEIGTIIPVERTDKVSIPHLWYPPRMREWVGERMARGLEGSTYSIAIRTYESTVAVPRQYVEDDQFGLIQMRVAELATEYTRWIHEQAISVLLNGQTLPSFDGDTLYSTARGAVNTNFVSSYPLNHANLQQAMSAMMSYQDPIEGRPLGIMPTHLVVGPKLKWVAATILESATIMWLAGTGTTDRAVGTRNPLQGELRLITTPYITTDSWFLVAAGSNQFRPIVRVDRTDVPLEFASRTTPDSDSVFTRDRYEYGIRARHGWGAGAWYAVFAALNS